MTLILNDIVDFTKHKYSPCWQVWYLELGYQNLHTKSFATKEQANNWANNNCKQKAAE